MKIGRSARLLSALLSLALLLTITVISPAQAVPVTVLTQNFEGGTFPPTGWSEFHGPKWTREANCTEFTIPSACASITGPGTEKFGLMTPSFNVSALTNPKIDFDVFISDPDLTASFDVMDAWDCTGFDGPNPPGTVHDPTGPSGTTATGLSHQSLPVAAKPVGYCLMFMFEQTDETAAPATVKIDNIVISGDGAGPPPNDPPVAPATKSFTVTEDTPLNLHFPASELNDPNGNPLTLNVTQAPGQGTLSDIEFLPGGMFVKYTPNPNFDGERNAAGNVFRGDEFKFKVNDGEFDSNETTVTIDMTPVNDAPEIQSPDSIDVLQDMPWFAFGIGPDPGQEAHCTNVGCSASPDVPLGVTDDAPGYPTATGFEERMIIETTSAAGGTMSLANTTGLTFSEGDGTDDQRMVFTGLWFAIDNALSAGVTYEPQFGYVGSDTLRLLIDDQGQVGLGGAKSAEKFIDISIGAINHRPTADDKTVTVSEDDSVPVTLTGDDPDGDTLTFNVLTDPAHGDLTGTAPNLTYTPDANYVGPDSFTYNVSDADLTSFVGGSVSITVNGITDPPVLSNLTFGAIEDQSTTFTLTPTSNQDNVPLTWEVGPAAVGTLFSNNVPIGFGANTLSSPTLKYTPAKDFTGTDYFLFRAKATIDGAPFETQWLQGAINVSNINDAPVAKNKVITLGPNEVVPITLEATDVDGDPLTFRLLNQPQKGVLTGTPPNLTYTAPNTGWHTSFGFEVSDGKQTAFGAVEIKVTLEQPDAMIVRADDSLFNRLGFNIFNSDAAGQTLDVDAPLGVPTDIQVDIYNPGFFTQKFEVQGDCGPQGWRIEYLLGGQDVTSALCSGKEYEIGSNQFLQLIMRVTPSTFEGGETLKAFVRATSTGEEQNVDAVAANIRAGTFQPDVLVNPDAGLRNALGDDIYNDTGSQQTVDQQGATGQTVYTHFYVENDGTAVDDFLVEGDVGPGMKWLRQISNDTDVTAAVEDGTYVIENVFPGQVADMLLVYDVPEGAPRDMPLHLTATSVTKGNSDTAIVNMESFGAGQPDLRIESDQRDNGMYGPAGGWGNDIYNFTAAGQTKYEVVHAGTKSIYMIELENDAAFPSLDHVEVYSMRACSGIDCRRPEDFGFHVKFWELNPRSFSPAEGNREITPSVMAGKDYEAPGKALADRIWLEISTDATAPVNAQLEFLMWSYAIGKPELQDMVSVQARIVKFRPDVEVIGAGQRVGANVYGNSSVQMIDAGLGSKDTQEVTFTVENDAQGNLVQQKDLITLNATPSGNGFSVQYLDFAGRDVTSLLTSGNWYKRMAVGEVATFKAIVTSPSKATPGMELKLQFSATSHSSSDTNGGIFGPVGPVEVGGANMKVVYRPDVAVGEDKGLQVSPVVGNGVYDPAVGTQELSADAKMLNTKNYIVSLSNDAPVADTLKATLDGTQTGFDVKVMDGTTDVTSKLRDGSYSVALPAGGVRDLKMTVQPTKRAREGARLGTTFTVNSATRSSGEPDAARIVTSAIISCDETSVKVGVVQIEGNCIMNTNTGYLSQEPLELNGVELSLYGPPAIIDKSRQTLATDEAELRFADYAIDTVVKIPVTLDGVVKTLCDEFLLAEDWRAGGSTCARSGATYVGEPLGLYAGEFLIRGNVNHLGQEPWGYVFGNRLPSDSQESWQHVLTWQSDGTPRIDLPVPPPDEFNGAPAQFPFTLGTTPPKFVETEFGTLNIAGVPIFTFLDAKLRQYLDTGERLLYGRIGFPGIPALTGFQFGAKFESGGTPEWILAKLRAGQAEELFPILPPHVYLDQATFLIEPQGPAVIGTVEADVWKLLGDGTRLGGLPGFLMSMKGSLAYEQERVSARGEMYLLGVIGPLADAKLTAGRDGIRATMNWNYSVGIGEIDFGAGIGKLDLGRLGFDAVIDGSGSGNGFEVSGAGTLHVFDSNVGLNAVISSLGAAGCATAKISSLGSGDVGIGAKWADGGSLEFLSNCTLSNYKDPAAPQHVNFDGFTTRFKAYLAEADTIDQLYQFGISQIPAGVQMLSDQI